MHSLHNHLSVSSSYFLSTIFFSGVVPKLQPYGIILWCNTLSPKTTLLLGETPMKNKEFYEEVRAIRRTEMDEETLESQLWGLHQQAIMATFNLKSFISTMLSNANVLKTLCGRTVFYGLNVAEAITPTSERVHELYQSLRNTDSWHTDSIESNYRFIKHSLNSVYRMRRDVRVLAQTVGLPTKKMTAEDLLNYARTHN